MRLGVLLALVALLGVSGATVVDAGAAKRKRTAIVKKTRAKAFGSCKALARYGRRHVSRGEGSGPSEPTALPGPPARTFGGPETQLGAPGAAPVAEEDSSTTNVQEAGVDEPDAVKSRGAVIFAVAGEQIHAIDTSGAAPKLLGSVAVEGYGHELLLFRDRLLVFTRGIGGPEPVPQPGPQAEPAQRTVAPYYQEDSTLLTEIDASDPAAMKIVKTEKAPGRFVSARLTGRTARVVVAASRRAIYEPGVRDEVAGWMPRRVTTDAATGRTRSRRLTACRSVRRPVTFSGLDLLTVLTVDMSKGLPAVDSEAIESGGEIVYASPRQSLRRDPAVDARAGLAAAGAAEDLHGDPPVRHLRRRQDDLPGERPRARLPAEPVLHVRAPRRAARGQHAGSVMVGRRPRRAGPELRDHARSRRRGARAARAGVGPRQGRAHLRGALRGRRGLRGHLPPDRSRCTRSTWPTRATRR